MDSDGLNLGPVPDVIDTVVKAVNLFTSVRNYQLLTNIGP
jgi:hypothetical protein